MIQHLINDLRRFRALPSDFINGSRRAAAFPQPQPRVVEREARPARIALLGCGNVGARVAARLLEIGRAIQANANGTTGSHAPRPLELVAVLVRDAARDRGLGSTATPPLFTTSFDDVLASKPDAIVELLGGLNPARDHVARALRAGIPVVTANKTLVAHHGPALERLAAEHRAAFVYEASVGAAVPILAALRRLQSGDRVLAVRGVVNGTCNHILTRMAKARLPLDRALAEAQARGYAEADPTADLSGRDSAEKACILAAAAGLGRFTPEDVDCTGIDRLTRADIEAAAEAGCVIKLLAEIDATTASISTTTTASTSKTAAAAGITLRVGPTWVPRRHALARVEGADNAFLVQTELAGELLFAGAGAGPSPTAAAILADLARVLNVPTLPAPTPPPPLCEPDRDVCDNENGHDGDGDHDKSASRRNRHRAEASLPSPPLRGRRHYVRIAASTPLGRAPTTPGRLPTPSAIFDRLRETGVEPDRIALHRHAAAVLTAPTSQPAVTALARSLAAARDSDDNYDSAHLLTMPVLETR